MGYGEGTAGDGNSFELSSKSEDEGRRRRVRRKGPKDNSNPYLRILAKRATQNIAEDRPAETKNRSAAREEEEQFEEDATLVWQGDPTPPTDEVGTPTVEEKNIVHYEEGHRDEVGGSHSNDGQGHDGVEKNSFAANEVGNVAPHLWSPPREEEQIMEDAIVFCDGVTSTTGVGGDNSDKEWKVGVMAAMTYVKYNEPAVSGSKYLINGDTNNVCLEVEPVTADEKCGFTAETKDVDEREVENKEVVENNEVGENKEVQGHKEVDQVLNKDEEEDMSRRRKLMDMEADECKKNKEENMEVHDKNKPHKQEVHETKYDAPHMNEADEMKEVEHKISVEDNIDGHENITGVENNEESEKEEVVEKIVKRGRGKKVYKKASWSRPKRVTRPSQVLQDPNIVFDVHQREHIRIRPKLVHYVCTIRDIIKDEEGLKPEQRTEEDVILFKCGDLFASLMNCYTIASCCGPGVDDNYVRVATAVYNKQWLKKYGDESSIRYMVDPMFAIHAMDEGGPLKGWRDCSRLAKSYAKSFKRKATRHFNVVFLPVLERSP